MSTGIKLTQSGQPRPYADSVFAGTVKADDEQDAREKLAASRYSDKILDTQSKENWSSPYFTKFKQLSEDEWEFEIIEEFTG